MNSIEKFPLHDTDLIQEKLKSFAQQEQEINLNYLFKKNKKRFDEYSVHAGQLCFDIVSTVLMSVLLTSLFVMQSRNIWATGFSAYFL